MNIGISDNICLFMPQLPQSIGMVCLQSSYSPWSFGNSEAIYGSDALWIRFSRERSELDAEIALPGKADGWADVDALRAEVAGLATPIPIGSNELDYFTKVFEFVRDHQPAIVARLTKTEELSQP
jgi:hypothetical protein